MDINNKVSIITGAGSGIGRAVALALLRENVNTFLIGRTLRILQETKKLSISKKYRGKAIVFK